MSEVFVQTSQTSGYLVGGLDLFLLFHILGIIIPIDFHIFQRHWNQPDRQVVILRQSNMAMISHEHLRWEISQPARHVWSWSSVNKTTYDSPQQEQPQPFPHPTESIRFCSESRGFHVKTRPNPPSIRQFAEFKPQVFATFSESIEVPSPLSCAKIKNICIDAAFQK